MSEPRLVLDFETYSEVSVKDVGAAVYAEHPSTEILCLSWKFKGTDRRGCWTPGMAFPVEVIQHIVRKGLCEAHNVQFEYYVWRNLLHRARTITSFGVSYPLPPIPMPTRWVCTLSMCAYRAMPLALDKVGAVLDLDIQKAARGKYLLRMLAQPRKPTKKDPSIRCSDYGMLEELYEYCDQDCDAEEILGTTLGDLPGSEYQVWLLDQKINMRGIQVDLELVDAGIKIRDEVFETMTKELIAITDGRVETGKQVKVMGEWLAEHGVELPNLQKSTVETSVDHLRKVIKKGKEQTFDAAKCLRVLEIRQVLGNASSAKLDKFRLTTCLDGRTRGSQQYHGGGTGRWAGRGIQPHNLPRGSVKNSTYIDRKGNEQWELDMDLLATHIKHGNTGLLELLYGNPLEAISTGLRGMMISALGKTLRVADFSAIEARGVMWLADQKDALKAFYDYDKGIGPDIYCVMAGHIYGREISKDDDPEERGLGKITVLGAGYQMGAPRLREQAEDSYGVVITETQSEHLIGTYRETYSNVPAMWEGTQEAAFNAITDGKRYDYRKVAYDIIDDEAGKWLVCILPNNRKLWYYNPKIIEATTSWGALKWSISYEGRDNKRGGAWTRVTSYGGMLVENYVQAVARDIMVAAMFRVEKAGYPIILTVHDEVIAETDDDYGSTEEFEKLLTGPNPSWAAGYPVAAEGWSGKRYHK